VDSGAGERGNTPALHFFTHKEGALSRWALLLGSVPGNYNGKTRHHMMHSLLTVNWKSGVSSPRPKIINGTKVMNHQTFSHFPCDVLQFCWQKIRGILIFQSMNIEDRFIHVKCVYVDRLRLCFLSEICWHFLWGVQCSLYKFLLKFAKIKPARISRLEGEDDILQGRLTPVKYNFAFIQKCCPTLKS
jgi:hypothetical protein